MKKFTKFSLATVLAAFVALGLAGTTMAAWTTPNLGAAASFGVLATTFNHDVATTTIYGDLGYVGAAGIGPVVIVGGATFVSGIDPKYLQAETDQDNALIDLNNLGTNPCTFTFGLLVTDLAADDTHDVNFNLAPGVYEPGVYCTAGAASTAAVTLSGAGTYIFRIAGGLDMVATTNVTLTNEASACDVFWTPSAATTIGANANFIGTVIGSPGISIGNAVTWTGRALASNFTVSADTDTITAPICTASLHVIKTVSGSVDLPSIFMVNVNLSGGVFSGSNSGTGGSGTLYTGLSAGTYIISEASYTGYTSSFSGSCLSGVIPLIAGDDLTCIITNTYSPPYIPPTPTPSGGGGGSSFATLSQSIHVVKVANRLTPFPYGGGNVVYTYAVTNPDTTSISNVVISDDKCSPLTSIGGDSDNDNLLDTTEVWTYTCSRHISVSTRNVVTVTGRANGVTVSDTAFANVVVGTPETPVVTPKLPKTGLPVEEQNSSWNIIMLASILMIVPASLLLALRKRKI